MPSQSFADALNEQIANEFAASQQYVAAAVYYDAETLPRLAAFFYRQALEEREHAMMMIRYLLDVGEEVRIPDIKAQLMSDLLNVVERSRENLLLAEDYIVREKLGEEGTDPTAPAAGE